jgi:hypothetical protein
VERLERGPLSSSLSLSLRSTLDFFLALEWKYETRRGYGYRTRGGERRDTVG